jgi:hypothetical protein
MIGGVIKTAVERECLLKACGKVCEEAYRLAGRFRHRPREARGRGELQEEEG